jgi:WD40 repeat protein
LSAFREEDEKFFFGRQKFVDSLVEVVYQQPLVAVIGASGSGKSSVVFAGMIPKLREQGNWLIESFRPNKQPFYELAAALVSQLELELGKTDKNIKAKELAESIRKHGFTADVSAILKDNPGKRVLLVIDQFEELYTGCAATEQQQFVDALLAAVELASRAVTLVLTLRADFYSYVVNYPPLGEALNKYPAQNLSLMKAEEMQAAIELPAKKMNVKLEEKLIQRILDDVKQEPGNLPLLEFALTQLWKKQSRGQLTHQAYSEIGGVAKALSNHAEAVYGKLSEGEQKQAQRIFLQLVRLGEGTEHTRRVATRGKVGEECWELIRRTDGLADARLVVTGRNEATGEETVEVAHEALIREWGRLQEWIESDRPFLAWLDQLQTAMAQWNADKDEGALLRGKPLVIAEDWLQKRQKDLTNEREYIEKSLALREREKAEKERQELEKLEAQLALEIAEERNKILTDANHKAKQKIRYSNVYLGVSIVLGAVFLWSAAIAIHKQIEAQKGTQLEQAGVNALLQFKSGQLNSLVSAMQSTQALQNLIRNGRDLKDYPAVSPVLAIQKILDGIHEQNYIEAGQGDVKGVVFLPGGDRFITAGEGKESKESTLQMWNLAGRKEVSLVGHEGGLHSGVNAVSVGGNTQNPVIASAGEDGTVRLWDRAGKQIRQLMAFGKQNNESFSAIAVSSDGRKIIAGQKNGTVYLWDKSGKQLKTWSAHENKVTAISFRRDGQTLATAGEDGLARIWTLAGNKLGELKQPEIKKMLGVSLSPDGKFVATASNDHRARIWTVNGQEFRRLEGHQEWVTVVNFSPNGQTVATGSNDGSVKLWNAKTGQQIQDFRGHRGVVWSASFSSDGKRLVSAGRDGFVRLWNLADKPIQRLELAGFQDDVNAIAFSPDGKAIAGAGNEGVMRLWDATSGKQLKVWQEAIFNKQNVQDIAFSPDGKFIVASGLISIARVWNLAGSLTEPQAKLKGVEGSQDGHQGYIGSVAVSPDSQLIVTGSFDKTMRIWKPKSPNGELVVVTPKQEGVVSRAVFTWDGQRIVTADWDGNIAIWDLVGNKLKQLKKWQKVHQNQIRGLGITRDGNRIVIADKSGYVKILDSSGNVQEEFFSYQSGINELAISPNGVLIATGGIDGTVRLWDFQGRQVAEFQNPKGAIWGVAFSPDSQRIALAGSNGFVSLRTIESLPSLMEKGCRWLQDYLESHPAEKRSLKICHQHKPQ